MIGKSMKLLSFKDMEQKKFTSFLFQSKGLMDDKKTFSPDLSGEKSYCFMNNTLQIFKKNITGFLNKQKNSKVSRNLIKKYLTIGFKVMHVSLASSI